LSRQLFRQVDPRFLERYTKKDIPRHRRISPEKLRMVVKLKRAMQELPPRELAMLFSVKINGIEQEEVRRIYAVRQSNVSYRLNRSRERIQLHLQIFDLVSETQLRRTLLDLGLNDHTIRAVTGVVRTSSQTAAADALEVSQGSVRHIYSQALQLLEEKLPKSSELELLRLIECNYNQLRCIEAQERWAWKRQCGGGDRP